TAPAAAAAASAPTFTALPDSGTTHLQTARTGAAAAPLPDGTVLIAGGFGTGGALTSAEIYDPATQTFTALPDTGATHLPTAPFGASAARLPAGTILIAGGRAAVGSSLTSAETYAPATQPFTALPDSGATHLQSARSFAAAVPLPDGTVLIAGS